MKFGVGQDSSMCSSRDFVGADTYGDHYVSVFFFILLPREGPIFSNIALKKGPKRP
jgi:hypothetical protein